MNDIPTIVASDMATTADVNVVGTWWNPFTLRTQIALDLKSIRYTIIDDGIMPKRSKLLLEEVDKSTLIHQGTTIPGLSFATFMYISDVWTSGHNIFPSFDDVSDKVAALDLSWYIDGHFLSYLNAALVSDEKDVAIDKLLEGLLKLEGAFNRFSKGNKFFGGHNIVDLDIGLGSLIGWFKVVEALNSGVKVLDETKVPSLVKWAEDNSDYKALC